MSLPSTKPAEPLFGFLMRSLNVVMVVFTRRDWRGQEHIPRDGGVLIAANHISNVDPLVLAHFVGYSGRRPRYLAKSGLFRVPLVGQALAALGQIPVQRGTVAARQAVTAAEAAIRSGEAVIVYPEGTITADPELWPMAGHSGVVRIALSTGCPVVPVGQWGAEEIMRGKQIQLPRLLPRKTVRLSAGPPVMLADLQNRPFSAELLAEGTARVMAAITAELVKLRGERANSEGNPG